MKTNSILFISGVAIGIILAKLLGIILIILGIFLIAYWIFRRRFKRKKHIS